MTVNPFDPNAILEGIRRWVEIETPTEAPEQVNRLTSLVARHPGKLEAKDRSAKILGQRMGRASHHWDLCGDLERKRA